MATTTRTKPIKTKKVKSTKKVKVASSSKSLDVPLSASAADLLSKIRPRIKMGLAEVNNIPVSVLVWGPGLTSDSLLLPVRLDIRKKLRELGHAAITSEELHDKTLPFSLRIQQLVQAQNFDIVVSIPCTPGSIAEVHDFISDRRVRSKLLVFLNEEYLDGYSPQSLKAINAMPACKVEYYPNERNTIYIVDKTLGEVQQIRESKYLLAGRL